MKTLLLTGDAALYRREIHTLAPELDLLDYRSELGDAELAEIDVVLGWRFPPNVAARLPKLRWVCSVAAGIEKLLVPELAPEVPLSRIVDPEQADGIAQYVVLMALRHARGLAGYAVQQRERVWRREAVAVVRSRVAVLGTGTMGGAVAKMLAGVGFEVEGWSRSSGTALDAVLARADIVVCALPLTPQTDRLLDARAFALMRRGSYLINIARGAHVVEADLIAAVTSGQLAGAALDVQQHEPMGADDPLWTVPGITITPHIAAQSAPRTIAEQFVAGLRCLQRGEPPPQQVDRLRGY